MAFLAFFLFLFGDIPHAQAKPVDNTLPILIITHAYNRPDFIEWQKRTLDAFLEEEYELVIFNDAPAGKVHDTIQTTCGKLNIQCIPVPQEIHSHLYPLALPPERFYTIPSARHADCIHYSLELIGFDYEGIVTIMDSDLFLIQPFSIAKVLEEHEIAAIMSPFFNLSDRCFSLSKSHYLWPGLVCIKMPELPHPRTLDFSPGVYPDFTIDTGGHTFFYLKANPKVRVNPLDYFVDGLHQDYLEIAEKLSKENKVKKLFTRGYTQQQISWLLKRDPRITVEFGYYNKLLHYRGASYENDPNHSIRDAAYIDAKTKWVKSHIDAIAPKTTKKNL